MHLMRTLFLDIEIFSSLGPKWHMIYLSTSTTKLGSTVFNFCELFQVFPCIGTYTGIRSRSVARSAAVRRHTRATGLLNAIHARSRYVCQSVRRRSLVNVFVARCYNRRLLPPRQPSISAIYCIGPELRTRR